MSTSLANRTVVVIGRDGGIARAVALSAEAAGADVVLAGRNVEGDGYVDLTDEDSIAALASRVGRVDHVVSTASARARGAVSDLDHATVLASFDVKVLGPMFLAKHFAPRMATDGSFVLFSGSSARKPTAGMLAVGATNGAVDVLTRGLAIELAPIRVNAVSPGWSTRVRTTRSGPPRTTSSRPARPPARFGGSAPSATSPQRSSSPSPTPSSPASRSASTAATLV
ncbi:hypothetical protein GCM10029964_037550 [Kibdelosporangium lantanae]